MTGEFPSKTIKLFFNVTSVPIQLLMRHNKPQTRKFYSALLTQYVSCFALRHNKHASYHNNVVISMCELYGDINASYFNFHQYLSLIDCI